MRFVEKPPPGTEPSNLINAGTYVLEPSVLDRIPLGERSSIERDTFPAIARDGRFSSLATDDYWIDAGRPDLYRQANLDLVNGRRAEVCDPIAPGARLAATARVVDSVIDDAEVGADATVVGSVVLSGAVIGAGAVVEDSIIAGTVGPEAVVVRTVVGSEGKIPSREQLRDARVPAAE